MNLVQTTQFRTLLILGRVSNLPTVWSNCLAGWWLGGGGNFWKLPFLLLGVSLLYTGGMFLNDAFDVELDRQRRPGRPIPSAKISLEKARRFGFGQLALGLALLLFAGKTAGALGLVLAFFLLLYNVTHKFVTAAPWLMGACRFWIYLIAGAAGMDGLNGWPIYCGAALALYIAGLSYVLQRERFRGKISFQPFLLLLSPVALALAMNTGDYRRTALEISAVLVLWIAFNARILFAAGAANAERIVTGLLAGIILVDWLAVAPQCPGWLNFILPLLFVVTKISQQFIPAT